MLGSGCEDGIHLRAPACFLSLCPWLASDDDQPTSFDFCSCDEWYQYFKISYQVIWKQRRNFIEKSNVQFAVARQCDVDKSPTPPVQKSKIVWSTECQKHVWMKAKIRYWKKDVQVLMSPGLPIINECICFKPSQWLRLQTKDDHTAWPSIVLLAVGAIHPANFSISDLNQHRVFTASIIHSIATDAIHNIQQTKDVQKFRRQNTCTSNQSVKLLLPSLLPLPLWPLYS